MVENTVVRARINERIKEEASAVLEAMGLTVSDAFRLLMVRIARDKALPFNPWFRVTKPLPPSRPPAVAN